LLASVDALVHGSTCETFGFLRARRLPSTEDHFRALSELYAAGLTVRSPRAE